MRASSMALHRQRDDGRLHRSGARLPAAYGLRARSSARIIGERGIDKRWISGTLRSCRQLQHAAAAGASCSFTPDKFRHPCRGIGKSPASDRRR